MAELVENDGGFVVALSGLERLGALRRKDLVIPHTSVARARRSSNLRHELRGVRMPGTSIPTRLQLGTWRHGDDKEFVAIYRDQTGYVVDLVDHDFLRLIVSTPRVDFLERGDEGWG